MENPLFPGASPQETGSNWTPGLGGATVVALPFGPIPPSISFGSRKECFSCENRLEERPKQLQKQAKPPFLAGFGRALGHDLLEEAVDGIRAVHRHGAQAFSELGTLVQP